MRSETDLGHRSAFRSNCVLINSETPSARSQWDNSEERDCVKGNLSKRHTDTQTKRMNELLRSRLRI